DLEKYDRAISFFETALKMADRQTEISKKDYADILCCYARVLGKKGRFKKAASCYCKAIEIVKMEEGEKNFYYLSVLLEVAYLCEKGKMYDQSIVYFKRAIETRKLIFEKTHLDYVTTLNSLASVFTKRGDYMRAVDTHMEVLNALKIIVGEEHAFYGDCINNIGVDYLKSGDFNKSMEYFQNALTFKSELAGINNLSYTISLECIGHVYKEKKNYEEAFEKYNEVRMIRKQISGENNLLYIESLMNLGKLFEAEGNLKRAKEYFLEALRIRKGLEISKDMGRVINLCQLAEVITKIGDKDEALSFMEESLNVRKSIYTKTHPRYARGLYYLAKTQSEFNMLQEAISNLEYAMEIQRETVGEDNPDFKDCTLLCRNVKILRCKQWTLKGIYKKSISEFEMITSLFSNKEFYEKQKFILTNAHIYSKAGDTVKAFNLIKNAKAEIMEKEGENTELFALALKEEGKLFVEIGRLQEGEEILVRALEIGYLLYGNENKLMAEISIFMGNYLLNEKEIDRAIDYFKKASTRKEGKYYSQALVGIGNCLCQNKDYVEAVKYLNDARLYIEENGNINTLEYTQILKTIALIWQKHKEFEGARIFLEKSTNIKKKLGIFDMEHSEDLLILSLLNKKLGNKENVAENLSEATTIVSKLEDDSPYFAEMLIKTAKAYNDIKKFETSVAFLEKAKDIYADYYGDLSDEYGSVLFEISKVYKKLKDVDSEQEILIELKNITEKNENSKFKDEKYFKYLKKN
ncbi:MAG: tetratricopeptide repeat protein, partial [Anaerotignaceae bacterium]